MHDDRHQQGSLVRPSSRWAWLLLMAVALATAAVVLLGHDAASADPIASNPDSGQAVTITVNGTAAPAPDAPSSLVPLDGDSWTTWLSSFGVLPVVSTSAPSSPQTSSSPPPSDDRSANQPQPATASQSSHSHRGRKHTAETNGSRGRHTDTATADDGQSVGAPSGTDSALAGPPMIRLSPLFGGPRSEVATTADLIRPSLSRSGRTEAAPAATQVSPSSTTPAPGGDEPANSDPAPLPLPAVPCPASGVATIGAGGTSMPAPVTTAPPAAAPRFTLVRTTCPPATEADRAAADARATNGSRGPPDERAS